VSRLSPFRVGPHDREILRLAVPALGALVAEPLYRLADTAVVGRLGTPELGGLAIAVTALATAYAVFIFLAYGTTAAVSRLLGAGDERQAAHQAVQGLWLAVGIGVVLGLVGLVLAEPLVELLGATGAVKVNALVYLRISLIGLPGTLIVLAGTGYLRGLQDTVFPLRVAVLTATLNLVVEVVLIFGLDQGIGASALSTVLAEWTAAAIYIRRITGAVRVHDVALRPDQRALRSLAVVGRDLLIRTAALRVSLTLATAVAARIGQADLAAHQIAFEIWSFLALVLDALAIAGQAMIGRLLGAGEADTARAAGRRMIEMGVIGGVVVGGAIIALRTVLPDLFTNDAAVASLTAFLLIWVGALQPINAVVFVLDGVLIGAGDMRFLAWAMVGAALIFVPVVLLVPVFDLGIGWVWGAIAVLMVSRMIALSARFHGTTWQKTGAHS
jgi:putative MATE family efflux protein